ncbi:hypothetical protein Riv7116_5133 [Rivularia sp. PCC 7116]|uniref:calcium-binding protein n=1 Tax=Rivularia sp. PCC 7116 TaxID=373994 RepID=UPI00029F4257|nr:calcium-binding protein [Rivularia sp. PCC 7116]AFY57530.1 hypothetical protein Riv7116_5133 [Rivularia sp. PCC 7116]
MDEIQDLGILQDAEVETSGLFTAGGNVEDTLSFTLEQPTNIEINGFSLTPTSDTVNDAGLFIPGSRVRFRIAEDANNNDVIDNGEVIAEPSQLPISTVTDPAVVFQEDLSAGSYLIELAPIGTVASPLISPELPTYQLTIDPTPLSTDNGGNDTDNGTVDNSGNDTDNGTVGDGGSDTDNGTVVDSGNDTDNGTVGDGGSDSDNVTIGDSRINTVTGSNQSESLFSSTNEALFGLGGDDRIYNNNGISLQFGGDGNDELYGNSLPDFLAGGADNDLIFGNGGSDMLFGGEGDDTIYGSSSAERFDGGEGNDILWLNGGEDIIVLRQGDGTDIINGFRLEQTQFELVDGLTFGNLSFEQSDSFTNILAGDEVLATVKWATAESLNDASNFNVV